MPARPPRPPRQQSTLKSSRDFSITGPIHPYMFFYHCTYPSIRPSLLFYHRFHPSTPKHRSPKHLPPLSLHPPTQLTPLRVPAVAGRGRGPCWGSGLSRVPRLGDISSFLFASSRRLPFQPRWGDGQSPSPAGTCSPWWVRGWVTVSVTNCLPKFLTKTLICAIYGTGSNLWRRVLRSVIKH